MLPSNSQSGKKTNYFCQTWETSKVNFQRSRGNTDKSYFSPFILNRFCFADFFVFNNTRFAERDKKKFIFSSNQTKWKRELERKLGNTDFCCSVGMGAENIRKPHHKSKPENFRVDASPQLLLQKLLIILKRLHVSIISASQSSKQHTHWPLRTAVWRPFEQLYLKTTPQKLWRGKKKKAVNEVEVKTKPRSSYLYMKIFIYSIHIIYAILCRDSS